MNKTGWADYFKGEFQDWFFSIFPLIFFFMLVLYLMVDDFVIIINLIEVLGKIYRLMDDFHGNRYVNALKWFSELNTILTALSILIALYLLYNIGERKAKTIKVAQKYCVFNLVAVTLVLFYMCTGIPDEILPMFGGVANAMMGALERGVKNIFLLLVFTHSKKAKEIFVE